MQKLGLIPRLIIAIVAGILIGFFFPQWFGNLLYTVSEIFGQLLMFVVPLIILGFIIPGLAELAESPGKLLGATAGLAYLTTVVMGTVAFFVGMSVIPALAPELMVIDEEAGLSQYLEIEIAPIIDVMTALVTAFVFGLGAHALRRRNNTSVLFNFMDEVREVTRMVIRKLIIPFLPLYIAGIFANMAAEGVVFETLAVFGPLFVLVIALQIAFLMVYFVIASRISPENPPFQSLKKMLPAYTTALGTVSSAATMPVTLQSAKTLNVEEDIPDFTVPLCATIHLTGSTIALVLSAVTVYVMQIGTPALSEFIPFILLLALVMIGAPGVPGGAVMAALGVMQVTLGFSEAHLALMIALYMGQDPFGTACNVTGDGGIAIMINKLAQKLKAKKNTEPESSTA